MKRIASIVACATLAVVGVAPAAFAKHKHHVHAAAVVAPVANPVVDAQGQFYATPVSAGPPSPAVLGVPVPGLDIATGVVGGVAQPVLAVPAAALAVPGQIIPGLVPPT